MSTKKSPVDRIKERHEAAELAYQAILASPEALANFCVIDGASGPVPLKLWPCQKRVIRSVLTNKRTLVLKARQVGISWASGVIALWWAMVHPGVTVLMLSIGERESVELLRRVRRLWESLPEPIRSRWSVDSAAHRFAIKSPHGTSAIVSLPSSSSAGRGYTVSFLVLDEAAFMSNGEERLAALLPTIGDQGNVLMLSTANGATGLFHDLWRGASGGENDWNPVFIRADERPGRGAEWIEAERNALGELAGQELPMTPSEAFISSGSGVFDAGTLHQVLETQCSEPVWIGRIERDATGVHAMKNKDGLWRVWQWPEKGRKYVIVADVCAGQGARDYSHAVIYDIESWDQVAYLHGKPTPGALAVELMNAGWLYQHDGRPAMLCPEANNYGQATIATLTDSGYPNLYHHNRMDQERPDETRLIGFYTSQKSKALAIGALQTGLRERTLGVRDPAFITEALGYIINDNGKLTAGPGLHDDRVMANAIASLVLQWSGVADALGSNTTRPSDLPRASFYMNDRGNRRDRIRTGTVA